MFSWLVAARCSAVQRVASVPRRRDATQCSGWRQRRPEARHTPHASHAARPSRRRPARRVAWGAAGPHDGKAAARTHAGPRGDHGGGGRRHSRERQHRERGAHGGWRRGGSAERRSACGEWCCCLAKWATLTLHEHLGHPEAARVGPQGTPSLGRPTRTSGPRLVLYCAAWDVASPRTTRAGLVRTSWDAARGTPRGTAAVPPRCVAAARAVVRGWAPWCCW